MKYELLYIIPATKTDEEVAKVKDAVSALLAKHGEECSRDESLGKLKLAYPIKNIRYGHYVFACFAAEPDNILQLDEDLRHMPDVLRHVTCRMKDGAETRNVELTEYEIPDVFKKRRPKKTAPAATPRPISKPDAKPMTEKELDEKLDKILEADIEKL
jgi:ribosomal protein S6